MHYISIFSPTTRKHLPVQMIQNHPLHVTLFHLGLVPNHFPHQFQEMLKVFQVMELGLDSNQDWLAPARCQRKDPLQVLVAALHQMEKVLQKIIARNQNHIICPKVNRYQTNFWKNWTKIINPCTSSEKEIRPHKLIKYPSLLALIIKNSIIMLGIDVLNKT